MREGKVAGRRITTGAVVHADEAEKNEEEEGQKLREPCEPSLLLLAPASSSSSPALLLLLLLLSTKARS